jgi:hypothetical protein
LACGTLGAIISDTTSFPFLAGVIIALVCPDNVPHQAIIEKWLISFFGYLFIFYFKNYPTDLLNHSKRKTITHAFSVADTSS